MVETEQAVKIIEAVSGFSVINVITLVIAAIALIMTLIQSFYKPNSLMVTISQITSEQNDYLIPITFINTGYQSNAILHVTNNAFYENPISKPNSESFQLYQLDAFTLKPGEVVIRNLRLNRSRIADDNMPKMYKPDVGIVSLKTFFGINFSIVTKSGKRINSKYLIGYHDAEMTENSYLSKGCYSIGDTSFNLLENRDFSSNKPVPMECFTKRKS